MKTLRLVKQLDECGCTIACMSMITGIPYFEIRSRLHSECSDAMKAGITDYKLIGLYCTEQQEFLEKIFGIPCRFIKFLSLNKLKKHCILSVCGLRGQGCHSIVFDAKIRCILDPWNGKEIKDLDKHNVKCCIEIR